MKMTGLRLIGLSTVNLPLFGAQSTDQFVLKAADGLGPVGRDVSFARGVYKRSEDQDREIVIRIGLNPNWSTGQTAGELRDILYGLLSDGITELLRVQIMEGASAAAEVSGVIRLMEIAAFTKDPEVQLTILCGEPHLKSVVSKNINLQAGTSAPQINIEGGLPTYFRLQAYISTPAEYFSFYMGDTRNRLRVDASMGPGAFLIVDGRPGQRRIEIGYPFTTEQGTTYNWYNILDGMTTDSVWPLISPGNGRILHMSQALQAGSISYLPIYRGV